MNFVQNRDTPTSSCNGIFHYNHNLSCVRQLNFSTLWDITVIVNIMSLGIGHHYHDDSQKEQNNSTRNCFTIAHR